MCVIVGKDWLPCCYRCLALLRERLGDGDYKKLKWLIEQPYAGIMQEDHRENKPKSMRHGGYWKWLCGGGSGACLASLLVISKDAEV